MKWQHEEIFYDNFDTRSDLHGKEKWNLGEFVFPALSGQGVIWYMDGLFPKSMSICRPRAFPRPLTSLGDLAIAGEEGCN